MRRNSSCSSYARNSAYSGSPYLNRRNSSAVLQQTGHVGGTAEQPRSSVTHTLRQRPSFCESQISQKSVLETFQATHESYQTDVTCPICHDIYTKPRFLRCYHSFCETCLEGIYKSNFPSQIIRCPFKCPLKTVITGHAGIKNLPLDHFKTRIIEERAVLLHINEYVISESEPRQETCIIEDDEDAKSLNTIVNYNPCKEIPEWCSTHTDIVVKEFCTVCDVPICVQCQIESHNEHDVIGIGKAVVMYKKRLHIIQMEINDDFERLQSRHSTLLKHLNAECSRVEIRLYQLNKERSILDGEFTTLKNKQTLTRYRLSGDVIKESAGIVNAVFEIEESNPTSFCRSVFVREAITAERDLKQLLTDLVAVENEKLSTVTNSSVIEEAEKSPGTQKLESDEPATAVPTENQRPFFNNSLLNRIHVEVVARSSTSTEDGKPTKLKEVASREPSPVAKHLTLQDHDRFNLAYYTGTVVNSPVYLSAIAVLLYVLVVQVLGAAIFGSAVQSIQHRPATFSTLLEDLDHVASDSGANLRRDQREFLLYTQSHARLKGFLAKPTDISTVNKNSDIEHVQSGATQSTRVHADVLTRAAGHRQNTQLDGTDSSQGSDSLRRSDGFSAQEDLEDGIHEKVIRELEAQEHAKKKSTNPVYLFTTILGVYGVEASKSPYSRKRVEQVSYCRDCEQQNQVLN